MFTLKNLLNDSKNDKLHSAFYGKYVEKFISKVFLITEKHQLRTKMCIFIAEVCKDNGFSNLCVEIY